MDDLVVLAVINQTGMYQRALVDSAQTAAKELGFALEVMSADADASRPATEVQKDQLFDVVFGRKQFQDRKVRALVIAAAGVGVHINRPVIEALTRGIDVVTLNIMVPEAGQLRGKYSERILAFVGPDQYMAGRIQGEQLKHLVPKGGFCLYITGPSQAWAPKERKRGLHEIIGEVGSDRTFDFSIIEGDWTAKKAYEQVSSWLQTAGSAKQLAAIVSQSDPMAMGAQEALQEYIQKQKRPDLATIPILGIDGCEGKKSVDEGKISATIVMAPSSKEALELLAHRERGTLIKDIKLSPKAYEPRIHPFSKAV